MLNAHGEYLTEVRRAKEKTGMEVDREVRPGIRRAAEDIYAVVQNARQVRVDVGKRVEEDERARTRAGKVTGVKGCHGTARSEADQVVRPV